MLYGNDNWDESEGPTTKVAVYGTLRQGEGNNRLLGDSKYLGQSTVPGYDMYSNGAFPYAVPGQGTLVVDLYEVSMATLTRLDRLEGYPSHYDRAIVKAGSHAAWMYFRAAQPQGLDLVATGDWKHQRVCQGRGKRAPRTRRGCPES